MRNDIKYGANNPFRIVTQQNFGDYRRERLPYVRSGHWGGDRLMLDHLLRGLPPKPAHDHRATVRDGTFSVLIGFAARKSIDEGRPVRIAELSDLEPGPVRQRADETA